MDRNNMSQIIISSDFDENNGHDDDNLKDLDIDHILIIHSGNEKINRKEDMKRSIKINYRSLIDQDIENSYETINILQNIYDKESMIIESISFSGGGYNCAYHLGVIKYIFENHDFFKTTVYLGASGGASVIGLILCYEKDPNSSAVLNNVINEIASIHELNLKMYEQVNKYVQILKRYITEEKFDQYIKGSNRYNISVTDVTNYIPHNVIIKQFDSYTHYIDIIRASACIPFVLDNTIRKVKENKYIDGGLSNNMPILNKNTIKISCLKYPFMKADLYPSESVNIGYAFIPPPKKYVLNMFKLGYCDMNRYMNHQNNRYINKKNDIEFDMYIHDIMNDELF